MTEFTLRPQLTGSFGAVASTHWLASAVGFGVLERGGNAFDAAVAAGFTLQVVEPHLNGPAGEVPMIVHLAERGRIVVVAGQGPAPKRATIAAFRDLELDMVPGSGLLAACVPAAFDSWMHLLAEYGTLPLAEVLAPAIQYAETGFPVSPALAASILMVRELFLHEWKSSGAVWLRGEDAPPVGGVLTNPALARSYRAIVRIAEQTAGGRAAQIEAARAAWSDGFVAEAIDRFVSTPAMDTSGRRHAGLIGGDDLAGWRVAEEAPLTYDYRGYTVAKCGPWSQGPVFLQQLALLAGFDLGEMDPNGPDFVHLVVEAAKLAFADREAYYGDPKFAQVPLEALLAPAHSAARRQLIGERASMDDRPSVLAGVEVTALRARQPVEAEAIGEPAARAARAAAKAAGDAIRRRGGVRGDTVHLDVCDRFGNMVSATPSGGWLMSSPLIPGLGFCLGTRAQMFWLEDGHPSALAPGKRPRSTLSPSFALRDGRPYLAFGTPGGDQQDQWSLVAFLRHVHHGLNLQQAIEAPAFHTEDFRSSFYPRAAKPGAMTVEARLGASTVRELRRRGHVVHVAPDWSQGWLSAVARTNDGRIHAAANPRGGFGYAVAR